jgi:uncharacterized protein YPO0396
MGRKKKDNKPKIIYKFEPFTEEQLDAAVKKLAHILAMKMGWVPKELGKKGNINQPDTEEEYWCKERQLREKIRPNN